MLSRKLLFPIFVLRLGLVNLLFGIKIAFLPIYQYKLLFITSCICIVYMLSFGKLLFSTPSSNPEPIKLVNMTQSPEKIVTITRFEQLSILKESLLSLHTVSPHNRNITLNLALINFYENNLDEYHYYWDIAQQIDPNNPLFK